MTASLNIIKVLSLTAFSAVLSFALTYPLTRILYKYKLWRKSARQNAIDGAPATIFNRLHKEKEVNTPRMAGILIWLTTIITIFFFALLNYLTNNYFFEKMDFLSRGQTYLPLGVLIAGAILGLFDDVFQIFGKGKYTAGGIRFTRRLLIVLLIAVISALWFYFKLGRDTIHIPGNGDFILGLWYLPIFVIVVLACWAGNVIDGLDGLAGGVFGVIFGAFGIIAFANQQYDLASFCFVITGALIAFLWFNIPPAKFYMGETGSIALTAVLAVVAFITDSVLVLPIIAMPLVLEAGSVIVQLISKRYFHRKVFLIAPLHHHLEAKGWPREQIVMRFWLFSLVFAIIGISIRLLG